MLLFLRLTILLAKGKRDEKYRIRILLGTDINTGLSKNKEKIYLPVGIGIVQVLVFFPDLYVF